MTIDQKKLLLEIANLHINDFMLEMNDHWNSSDYALSKKYQGLMHDLEGSYRHLYGDLPEWEYIDDVVAFRDNIKKELTEVTENG